MNETKKKIAGFYIESDCRIKGSEIITGFSARKDAENFAIEFNLTWAKIHAIIE